MNTQKLLAQIHNPILPDTIGGGKTPDANTALPAAGNFLSSIVSLLLLVSLVATFLYLVLGGIQWITSGGDKTQLENARNRITNAIIGLVVVASAWAIWLLIGKFFGIDTQNIPFPTVTGP